MNERALIGRPRENGSREELYNHELYKLLQEKLPIRFRFYDGRIDTKQLADDTGFARWTIYRWFKGENMSPTSAKKLVRLSEQADCERKGALTMDMLTKFIIGA